MPHAGVVRLVALLLFLSACDEYVSPAKAKDRKIAELEARLASMERQSKDEEKARSDRSYSFEVCILDADIAYWDYIRLNGRIARKTAEGNVYRAPSHIWAQASKDKENAIAICKATWK
jgi:hypothetical protein